MIIRSDNAQDYVYFFYIIIDNQSLKISNSLYYFKNNSENKNKRKCKFITL